MSSVAINSGSAQTGAVNLAVVDLSSAQSIGGVKTFTSTVAANISGNAATATTANTVTTVPALSGDVTTNGSSNATTVAKIQGTTIAAPSGGATSFLNASGTWTTPSGSATATIVAAPTGVQATDASNIATAISTAGAGGTLYFQAGTYVADNLAPLAAQKWTGAPNAIIQRPASSTNSIVKAGSIGSGIASAVIDGLTFDGNRSNSTATSNGMIYAISPTNWAIRHCTFQNAPTGNSAVILENANYCTVQDNYFATVGYAITIGQQISESAGSYTSNNNKIVGNVINTTDHDAIFVTENMASNGPTTVAVASNGQTINQTGATVTLASTTSFSSMGTSGTGLFGGPGQFGSSAGTPFTYTGISGSTLTGVTIATGSITLSTSEQCAPTVFYAVIGTLVENNTIRGAGDTGIETGSGCIGSVVKGNHVYGSTNQGYLIRDAKDCILQGNTTDVSSNAGVYVFNLNYRSQGINIIGNNFLNVSSGQGILVNGDVANYGGTVIDVKIVGNTIDGGTVSTSDGIRLYNVAGFTISDNTITSCGWNGIACGATAAHSAYDGNILGNRIYGNSTQSSGSKNGINISYQSQNITIANNRIGESPTGAAASQKYCIDVTDATVSNVLIQGNFLTNYTSAVITNASTAASVIFRNNPGYNPLGSVTVTVPGTGTAVAAAAVDRTFYITTSTGTSTFAISSGPTVTIPASGFGTVRVPAGTTLTPTYTAAPTWVVEGE
ncbi:MAG TPA: right-handed parallel beta-helix repeat-containing protein [Candidatus Saccharimonadales bacterium]